LYTCAAKLQSDVRRLQNALEEKREHRLESSESILVDARARIEALHRSVGVGALSLQHEGEDGQQQELRAVLETLVDDNETLKRDNAELQALLADAREDCRALQEEVEDQRVNPPPRSGGTFPSPSKRSLC
jgi:chromosome segregation ATPase